MSSNRRNELATTRATTATRWWSELTLMDVADVPPGVVTATTCYRITGVYLARGGMNPTWRTLAFYPSFTELEAIRGHADPAVAAAALLDRLVSAPTVV